MLRSSPSPPRQSAADLAARRSGGTVPRRTRRRTVDIYTEPDSRYLHGAGQQISTRRRTEDIYTAPPGHWSVVNTRQTFLQSTDSSSSNLFQWQCLSFCSWGWIMLGLVMLTVKVKDIICQILKNEVKVLKKCVEMFADQIIDIH